jgi:ribosome-associated heat shock protein Hsp15
MDGKQDEDRPSPDQAEAPGTQRLDKWLWFARFLKSRTLAAQLVLDGKVRINRMRVVKPSQTVRAGDVLTIAMRGRVHVLRVLAPGERRGPPPEARRLYEVLTTPGPDAPPHAAGPGRREPGTARPTKRDRRRIDRLTDEQD